MEEIEFAVFPSYVFMVVEGRKEAFWVIVELLVIGLIARISSFREIQQFRVHIFRRIIEAKGHYKLQKNNPLEVFPLWVVLVLFFILSV